MNYYGLILKIFLQQITKYFESEDSANANICPTCPFSPDDLLFLDMPSTFDNFLKFVISPEKINPEDLLLIEPVKKGSIPYYAVITGRKKGIRS